MKKIFSIASALMLALGMGMTSCSNDIDEVVTEQQPEMHKLYLTASVPQTPETRSYAEGVEGKEDAIKITGWKAGDVVYGLYYPGTGDMAEKLAFTFNGDTHEFESGSTTVPNDQIKCFVYGDFDFSKGDGIYSFDPSTFFGELYFNTLTIDVANNYTNIPMWGAASVVGDKLTTNMQMAGKMAFLCLHNSSSASIDVRIATKSFSKLYYLVADNTRFSFTFDDHSREMDFSWFFPYDPPGKNLAKVTTIAAGKKAYLPISCRVSLDQEVQVFIGDNDTPFATKNRGTFEAGKIYKLNYTGQ